MRIHSLGKPSPGPADLRRAPETMPDGPNVAPSLHEHEAALGHLEEPRAEEPGTQDTADSGAADGVGAREERIRAAAYAMSAQRGFEPGRDVDDWLEAERQIDADAAPPRPA